MKRPPNCPCAACTLFRIFGMVSVDMTEDEVQEYLDSKMEEEMKEKPILFSSEMIRAILDGRKTQTRRIIKPQPDTRKARWNGREWEFYKGYPHGHDTLLHPYGGRLWVRETWYTEPKYNDYRPSEIVEGAPIWYIADWPDSDTHSGDGKTRPSIFMCRWMSRINLRIKRVWVEQVQDISEEDACAEGCNLDWYGDMGGTEDLWPCPKCDGWQLHGAVGPNLGFMEVDCMECNTSKKMFQHLWNSINLKRGYGWDDNPWVWCIEFEVEETVEEDAER